MQDSRHNQFASTPKNRSLPPATKSRRSDADFISKIEGSLQELEETEYWLELWAVFLILSL
jgi:hypothetical protein